uniref:Transmembrane protein 44 n=1 Tax=Macrostomum lignano TaxID=282301 RepID=A0A1I8F7R3_9PLAT
TEATGLGHVALISIGGWRSRPRAVALPLTSHRLGPHSAAQCPVGFGQSHHRCIVWCKQLVIALCRSLFSTAAAVAVTQSVVAEFRRHLCHRRRLDLNSILKSAKPASDESGRWFYRDLADPRHPLEAIRAMRRVNQCFDSMWPTAGSLPPSGLHRRLGRIDCRRRRRAAASKPPLLWLLWDRLRIRQTEVLFELGESSEVASPAACLQLWPVSANLSPLSQHQTRSPPRSRVSLLSAADPVNAAWSGYEAQLRSNKLRSPGRQWSGILAQETAARENRHSLLKVGETSSSSNSNSSSADMRSHQSNLSAVCSILTCLCGPRCLCGQSFAIWSGLCQWPIRTTVLSIAFALIYALDSMLGGGLRDWRFYAPPMRLSWPMAVCLSVLLGTAASQLHGNYVGLNRLILLLLGACTAARALLSSGYLSSGAPIRAKKD